MIGASVFLLTALLIITAYQLRTATTDATIEGIVDITQSIQLELLTARSVGDGYARAFQLPYRIQGRAYEITVENDNETAVVTVTTAGRSIGIRTPACNGTLAPGWNNLTTANGSILCN